MAVSTRSKPKRVSLQGRFLGQLIRYTAATGAALSLTTRAEAKVVYVPVDNVPLTNGFRLSIAGEPVVVFNIYPGEYTYIAALAPRGLVVTARGGRGVGKLSAGSQIGPGQPFAIGLRQLDEHVGTDSGPGLSFGPWFAEYGYPTSGYLGFRFEVSGQLHFGWARLTVSREASFTLDGYAYETIAGKAITAGQTSGPMSPEDNRIGAAAVPANPSLGMLAFGSRALELWRKE